MIRSLAGRASWGLADQIISSLGNGLLSILVAHSVDSGGFGGFALAFTVFTLLIGISRAVATSPLGIRFSDAPADDFRRATAAATGAALTLSVLGGIGCLVAGAVVGHAVGPALLSLGVILPALIVQDAWRQVFFAAGRPAAAALNDTVWVIGEIAVVSALLANGKALPQLLILGWGVSAIPAVLLGMRQCGAIPRPWRAFVWMRDHRTLTGYMAAEFATMHGTYQAALLFIGTFGSLDAIGALRGVQVLLSPTNILAVAAFSSAVPELARRRPVLSERQWYLGALVISGSVALLSLAWGTICALLPTSVGRALLGDTWAGTSDILWASIIGQFGSTLAVGPVAVLYSMDRARVTLGVQILLAPAVFIAATGGVLLYGAQGAAWGLCLAYWAGLPWWAYRMRGQVRALVRGSRDVDAAEVGAGQGHSE